MSLREQASEHQRAFVVAVSKLKLALSSVETASTELVQLMQSSGVIDSETAAALGTSLLQSIQPPAELDVPAVADKSRKKRAKRPVDPDAPKRPLPEVLRYLNSVKQEIRQDREQKGLPVLSMVELNALAQESWGNLPESKQAEIKQQQDVNLKKYYEEMTEYRAKKEKDAVPKSDPEDADISAVEEVHEEAEPEAEEVAEAPKKKKRSKKTKEDSPKKKSKKEKE